MVDKLTPKQKKQLMGPTVKTGGANVPTAMLFGDIGSKRRELRAKGQMASAYDYGKGAAQDGWTREDYHTHVTSPIYQNSDEDVSEHMKGYDESPYANRAIHKKKYGR